MAGLVTADDPSTVDPAGQDVPESLGEVLAEAPGVVLPQVMAWPAPFAGRDLRRNREFLIVLAGQTVSVFGDAVTSTALPLLIVALTGSGFVMGIVGVLQRLPDLILGLPAGAWADRWDRRRMIIWADLGRAVLTALIPVSIAAGWDAVVVVLIVTLPINCLRVLFLAAWTAVMPSIVGQRQVGRASGYAEAVFNLSFIAGPAIAGIMVSVIGTGPTLVLDALTFCVSAGSLMLIRRPLRAERSGPPPRLVEDIREGLRYMIGQPVLRVSVTFWSVVAVVTAPIATAAIFLLAEDRHQSAEVVGLVLSAYGVGSLVGALVATRLSHMRLGRLMLVANAGTAIAIGCFAVTSDPALQGLFAVLAGVAGSLVFVPYLTLRSTIPPDHLMGRVGSTARTISVGLAPIGTLTVGVLLDLFGGEATLLVMALVVAAASLVFAGSRVLREAVAADRGLTTVDPTAVG